MEQIVGTISYSSIEQECSFKLLIDDNSQIVEIHVLHV